MKQNGYLRDAHVENIMYGRAFGRSNKNRKEKYTVWFFFIHTLVDVTYFHADTLDNFDMFYYSLYVLEYQWISFNN